MRRARNWRLKSASLFIAVTSVLNAADPYHLQDEQRTHKAADSTLSVNSNGAPLIPGSPTSICAGNSFSKNVSAQNNTGALLIFDNTVGHSLGCTANSSISGGGNNAPVKNGQCSGF